MKTITSTESTQFLAENYIGRLGYISKERVEIIPITYCFDTDHHSILSYSGQGNKIDAMRKNPLVSFQVDEITNLEKWKSVLLHGKFEELTGIDAKYMLRIFSEGVKKVIKAKEKSSPGFIRDFSSKITNSITPIVYRINIDEITGRQRE
ncbi:pyridoxamine 5'-phosphate oxidase family protein [Salegentibacter sp. Hel_I_6]|uniref:pyridoxamine 5'-phosphate oxidase family protein n=1 Tax=Salegentibacter sp. Hel_I_6 TaxID=1250278 RepID=UPI00055C96B3|nr:pyridoxamine 5'-phosphate oxidase family protein [Salegentibacter sp. Hel_I_6]